VKETDPYVTLKGQEISLVGLDSEEKQLLARLRRRATRHPNWTEFGTYWMREVAAFYDARGLSRTQSRHTPVYQVAQDLCSRMGVAAELVRAPEYRDELEELIHEKFRTRRAFCEATGLSEAMLSHVLAGRKDLSLTALTKALERIGYTLRILPRAPAETIKQTAPKRSKRRAKSA
jgi:hypothetical protein